MAQTRAQVSKLLTNVSNQFINDKMIADEIFPIVRVKQNTGLLAGYGLGHLRQENDLMGGRSEARRVDAVERQTSPFEVVDHGLETVVTQDDYDNVEEPFDAEVDETETVSSIVKVNKEIFARNIVMNPATITAGVTLAGADQFSDPASTPLDVASDAAIATLANSGHSFNAAIMSKRTFLYLRYNVSILSNLGYSANRAGSLSKEDIMAAFGLDYLYIGDAAYNSAKQGQPGVLTPIWGSGMLFYYRPPTAGRNQTSLGYQIRKMSTENRAVYKYPLNNPPGATGIIVQDAYDFRIVNPSAGYLVQATY